METRKGYDSERRRKNNSKADRSGSRRRRALRKIFQGRFHDQKRIRILQSRFGARYALSQRDRLHKNHPRYSIYLFFFRRIDISRIFDRLKHIVFFTQLPRVTSFASISETNFVWNNRRIVASIIWRYETGLTGIPTW